MTLGEHDDVPQYPEPPGEMTRKLFAVIATVLSGAERDPNGRRVIARDALVAKLQSLHHSIAAIEWAIYLGKERGYFEPSLVTREEQRQVGRFAVEARRHQATVPAVAATDQLWDAWKTGKLSETVERKVVDKSILLALSGGGLRATLFHLGVLIYLQNANRLKDVAGLVSVSGGSILAAHFVKEWPRATANHDGFVGVSVELLQFARSNLRDSVIIPWIWSRLLPWKWQRRFGRTARLEAAYRRHFGEVTLGMLCGPDYPRIALVATDSIRQERIAFTADRIMRFPLTSTEHNEKDNPVVTIADGVMLSLGVTASSCFPPVFRRMHLNYSDLGLTYAEFKEALSLNDGGVTGNLGIKVLLALRALDGVVAETTIACDAQRPQSSKPADTLLSDQNAQAAAVSQSERADFARDIGNMGVIIRLSERVPAPLGLPFRVQTLLAGFRTDLDAPSWQEIHSLLLHGAASAANKLESGALPDCHESQKGIVLEILKRAGAPEDIVDPCEADLKHSHRRPLRHVIVSVVCVLSMLATAIVLGWKCL